MSSLEPLRGVKHSVHDERLHVYEDTNEGEASPVQVPETPQRCLLRFAKKEWLYVRRKGKCISIYMGMI